jgi:predicted transcriptional regulator YheO
MRGEVLERNGKGTQPGTPGELSKEATLELLKIIGEAVSATLGEWCEVVVHDLADLEHSIVFIGGNVTGRKVGGHMTDLGLAHLRSGRTEPLINYTSYTNDGKTLRSSSMFIHDKHSNPIASFCINLNVTPLFLFTRFLRTLLADEDEADIAEIFSEDLAQMVETMVAECAYRIGKPISLMTKSDRMEVVHLLDEKGIFQLRKSVPLVAKRLGVTQKTIYNYLAELQGEQE